MTPTTDDKIQAALDALDEWQISRATGNPDLEHEKAKVMVKAVRQCLISAQKPCGECAEQKRQFNAALVHERSLTEFWSKRVDDEIEKGDGLVKALEGIKDEWGEEYGLAGIAMMVDDALAAYQGEEMIGKMFEEPVSCSCCGKIIELDECHFIDPDDNTYGVCDKCKKFVTARIK